MRTRSHSKAFRNAVLWTWWIPLFFAAIAGGLRYSFDKDQPDEYIATGEIVLTLPDGQPPDKATIEAHITLLESSSLAERAAEITLRAHPEVQVPRGEIMVTHRTGGLLNAIAVGPDDKGVQAFLNEGMNAYITEVELMRRDRSPAGAELNRHAVPVILELAGPAAHKQRELWLPVGLTAVAGGGVGLLVTLVLCSLWAFLRPANIQPSLADIMKAAAGLDPTARSVLAEWLRAQE